MGEDRVSKPQAKAGEGMCEQVNVSQAECECEGIMSSAEYTNEQSFTFHFPLPLPTRIIKSFPFFSPLEIEKLSTPKLGLQLNKVRIIDPLITNSTILMTYKGSTPIKPSALKSPINQQLKHIIISPRQCKPMKLQADPQQ